MPAGCVLTNCMLVYYLQELQLMTDSSLEKDKTIVKLTDDNGEMHIASTFFYVKYVYSNI